MATLEAAAFAFVTPMRSSGANAIAKRITCCGAGGGAGLRVHAAVPATAAPTITAAAVDNQRARFHEAAGRATGTAMLAETARPESVSRLRRARSARTSAAL